MEIINEIISQIRKIRMELKVEPGKLIHAIIYAGKTSKQFETKREVLMRLARLKTLEISNKGPKVPQAKAIFIGNIKIYLPLKDLIDSKKEIKRLHQEIEAKENFIKGLERKFKDKNFITKAPAEIIERERQRLKEAKITHQQLKAQLESLS